MESRLGHGGYSVLSTSVTVTASVHCTMFISMLLSIYHRKIYFVYCWWSQLEAEAGCPAGHEALYLRLPHHVPRVRVVVGPRVGAATSH